MLKINNIKAPILSFFLLFSLAGFAGDLSENDALTLEDVLRHTVKSHPLVLSAEAEYLASKKELAASRWSRFPVIGASAQNSNIADKQGVTTASMPIWMGGRINASIDLAKSRSGAALSGIAEAEQTVIIEAISHFFEYYKSEQRLLIARKNVDEHQRLFDIIERRVAAATSPDVDNMLAQARLQAAKSAEIQASGLRDISKASLELTFGSPINSLMVKSDIEQFSTSLQETVTLAISESPRISRLEAEVRGFEAEIKSAQSGLYPQISLGYEKRYNNPNLLPGEREQTFISVDFQPGAGLATISSVSAAKQRKLSALDNLRAEKRELERTIKSEWSDHASLAYQLEPARELVQATNSVVESYIRQYAVGKKSWLDVLNAQREATQAKNTQLDFEVQYISSWYRLNVFLNNINSITLGN